VHQQVVNQEEGDENVRIGFKVLVLPLDHAVELQETQQVDKSVYYARVKAHESDHLEVLEPDWQFESKGDAHQTLSDQEESAAKEVQIHVSPELVEPHVKDQVIQNAEDDENGVRNSEQPEVKAPSEVRDEGPYVAHMLLDFTVVRDVF